MANFNQSIDRRRVLQGLGVTSGAALSGTLLSFNTPALAADFEVSMQLGWLISNGQLGEVAADHLGYYKEAGLAFKIVAGGPNVDGVASVASGRSNVGQLSSSPSLMLARSAGIPIRAVAAGYQEHPFTYFSLKKNPINEPKDMIGKTIATQGTARILLRALLAKHNIAESEVEVLVMGDAMGALMSGQVHAVTGWQSNIKALEILGEQRVDLRLWDAGIQLYANPYYVTDETLEKHRDRVNAFIGASSRGWGWVAANPEKAVDILVSRYPNLDKASELKAVKIILDYVFNAKTKSHGWGTMNRENWEAQVKTYADLGQFKNKVPGVDDVMTLSVLEATAAVRPKIG